MAPNVHESYRHHASHAVARADQQYRQQHGGASPHALGYVRTPDRHQKVYLFMAPGEARRWYASLVPGQHSYAALFAAGNLVTPHAENFGSRAAVSGAWVGGWWDSVSNAVLTVTGTKITNQFIHDHHLDPYVKLAATAVATAYGGPAAGAAAGALSGPVMSLGVEDKEQAQAAAQDVKGVKQLAHQTHPELGKAADIAQAAIEQTATTYHVAQIVKDAKAGKPAAQKALADLNTAATQGDTKSALALQLAAAIDQAQSKTPATPATPGPAVGQWYDIAGVVLGIDVGCDPVTVGRWYDIVGGWYDIVGATLPLDEVRTRAKALATAKEGNAIVAVHSRIDGHWHTFVFASLDDAIDGLQRATSDRASFTYAAAYEKGNDGTAYIQDEEIGNARAPSKADTRSPAMTMGGW